MAFRAGAEITDMEFVQFHPTALYLKNAPRFLLSEALRGEGAYLRNLECSASCEVSPLAELAPRDVVARAIVTNSKSAAPRSRRLSRSPHLDADFVQARFPRIYATCLQYSIDITSEPTPIRPAAHYAMGGVRTDLDGRSNLPGLYAAGEPRPPASMAPTVWPAIPCLKAWSSAPAPAKPCARSWASRPQPSVPLTLSPSNGPVDASHRASHG